MATVLLVEHETGLLEVLGEVLHRAHHIVLAAPSAECAIQAGRIPTNKIDVLLCDVLMGGTSGFEIAATVKAAHPHVFVILMSGAPGDTFPADDVADKFLQKPFAVHELLHTISQAIAPGDTQESSHNHPR